ncbi:MAG TPA: hypothetical protein VHV55_06805 [Pirellulales bacterium]|jgi:hypothetical protein|nr:hypothetical protein [Pirellulales bacterium]
MSTSRVVGIGWLALALVASSVSAAGPKNSKPEQQAAVGTPPKVVPPHAPEGMLVVDTQTLGNSAHIEKALDEPTEVEFIEAPLTDVIEFLKTRHQVEMQLDRKALDEAGVAADTQITRNLKGISLRSALRLMLRDLELTYVIRDEVLLITTVSNAETIHTTRVYAVGDLLRSASDDALQSNPAHDLIAAIVKTVAFTTWSDVGGAGAICYSPEAQGLVISQTAEVHEQIYGLLVAMRKVRAATGAQPGAQAADHNPDKMFVVTYFLKPSAAATPAAKQPGKDEKAAAQAPVEAVAKRDLADDLARAIPEVIEPASWKNNGGQGTIESIGVGVVVRQTRLGQHQVLRFLQPFGVSGAPAGAEVDGPTLSDGGGSF